MIRLDGRTPKQVADLIRWAQRDEFWMANVLSMDTLREKFDQLDLKKGHPSGNGHNPRKAPAITGSAVDNTLALLEGGGQ
jgi:hypothetical protein